MNANDLLDIIGEAKGTYIAQAQEIRSRERKPRGLSLKRTVLIAAVIALMLLLVGCTVAYVLSLQDMKIAETTTTKRFNDEGRIIEPTEVTQDVISLHGFHDSPLQQAAKEWYEFVQSYDTDKTLLNEAGNAQNPNGVSDDYWMIYDCYTQEMVQKVNEIAEKYSLKLLSGDTLVQRYQTDIFFETLGLESLFRSDAQVDVTYTSGSFYQNGSFNLGADFTMTGENAAWDSEIWSTVRYAQKDYFDPSYTTIETDSYDQWTYTTSDGTVLLLAQNGLSAMIFAQQENAMITISLNFDTDFGYPYDDGPVPDKTAIEQAAEVFDYSIQPQSVEDYAAVEAKLEAAEAQWEASRQEPVTEYASFGEYLLNDFWIDDRYYVLWDVDENGAENLLIGPGDGSIKTVLFQGDGKVTEEFWDNCRLCENGYIAYCSSSEDYNFVEYVYTKQTADGRELVEGVECRDGNWEKLLSDNTLQTETITEAEAEAIRSKYPYLELDWKPALQYVVEGRGETVGDLLREQEVILSQEDRREIFARTASVNRSIFTRKYYTFLDINGDGQEELLLGADEESFNQIYIIRRGKAKVIYEATSYLYEGNIVGRQGDGVEYEQGWYKFYSYNKLDGTQWTTRDALYYWQGTDSWTINKFGTEFTEDEANAIMDEYIPAELNMRPIGELMDAYGIE